MKIRRPSRNLDVHIRLERARTCVRLATSRKNKPCKQTLYNHIYSAEHNKRRPASFEQPPIRKLPFLVACRHQKPALLNKRDFLLGREHRQKLFDTHRFLQDCRGIDNRQCVPCYCAVNGCSTSILPNDDSISYARRK